MSLLEEGSRAWRVALLAKEIGQQQGNESKIVAHFSSIIAFNDRRDHSSRADFRRPGLTDNAGGGTARPPQKTFIRKGERESVFQ